MNIFSWAKKKDKVRVDEIDLAVTPFKKKAIEPRNYKYIHFTDICLIDLCALAVLCFCAVLISSPLFHK